jgi:DNA-binding response OmpR family regulator
MRRNAQRLLNLINQLLELSKLDSGNVTLNASPRDMVSFLKGLTASFELLTTRKDQQLVFQAPGEEIIVYFDLTRMEEVFCNLLINAVKFTPAGGKITVSLNPDRPDPEDPLFPRGSVSIEVSDTGPGIPPDRAKQIFQRFYYSENTSEQEQKGTGIGLALAKEWVELHHGDISASGREGSGSRFTVRLPLGKEHLEPHEIADLAQSPGSPNSPSSHYMQGSPAAYYTDIIDEEIEIESGNTVIEPFAGDKEIVLVVDDSADVRGYIRDALEPGYKVVEAENGKAGMEKAFQVIPDLVVSDVMMPETDGIELCRTLKQDRRTSHIPVVLLTAKASEENLLEGLETGADDYITKPFSIRVLRARIKNLIELRQSFQQDRKREMRMQPVKTAVSDLDREFFKDVHNVIDSNLEDPDFNVDQLASKLFMGRTTVYRKITALCGETPTDYIRSYRLKRAAQLLLAGNVSVTEVAFEVGFNSRTYFTKCFKETFHCLPSDYRKNH